MYSYVSFTKCSHRVAVKIRSQLHTHVHSSTIHKSPGVEAAICLLTDEWINNMDSVHTMEYSAALKRKEILLHATTQMNLEDIVLNEISQAQKDRYT